MRLGTWAKRTRFGERAGFPLLLIFLAVLQGISISYLKVNYYRAWRYTSDLFTYDTVIQETARGNLALEFTYGNTFGDHGYLFLIFLTPIKYLLKSRMIYLLLLLGPLTYAISAVIVYFSIRRMSDTRKAFLITSIYLLGFAYITQGLIEFPYGMHPDTFSGFIAVALTAMLVWREKNRIARQNSKFLSFGIVFVLLAYLLIKEEMAVLAVCFFVIVYLLQRSMFNFRLLLLSTLFLTIELVVIQLSQSSFNRGNQSLIFRMIDRIKINFSDFFLYNPNGNTHQPVFFWLIISLVIFLILVGIRLSSNYSPYVLALFSIGLIKFFFSLSVLDYSMITWHNFPALIMVSTAILLQSLFIDKVPKRSVVIALILLFTVSVICFLWFDFTFIKVQLVKNENRLQMITAYQDEIAKIRKQIDPMSIVAIPQFTARAWVGYRYSFYPRGVSWSPIGIADYVVYPLDEASIMAGGYEEKLPLEDVLKSFSVVMQTPNFVLLKRESISESEKSSRQLFFQEFRLSPDQ